MVEGEDNPTYKGSVWRNILNSKTPWELDLPAPYDKTLSPFQTLLVFKFISQEKLVAFIKNYIVKSLDKRFIVSAAFNLDSAFEDSSLMIPIIFVLSVGADPMRYLLDSAKAHGKFPSGFTNISLGQG